MSPRFLRFLSKTTWTWDISCLSTQSGSHPNSSSLKTAQLEISILKNLFGREFIPRKMEVLSYLPQANIGSRLDSKERNALLKLMTGCLVIQRKGFFFQEQ
jgi:hypothetical protein